MEFSHQYIAFRAILDKEVTRFFRIWTQTFLPSAITQSLYFLIFGGLIGSQIRPIGGISYMGFIIPGLIMMAIIMNAYLNVASSFFSAKFQRNIEELLVAPVSSWTIIAGYTVASVLRGVIVGTIVYAVSCVFFAPRIDHPVVMVLFMLLTAFVFSLAGLLNGIFAKKFDDVGIVPTFVLTPLTYLGGVFYGIQSLPPFWQMVSRANPIVYMIDGFRYGFYGIASMSPVVNAALLVALAVILLSVNKYLLDRGYGMKS